MKPYDFDGVRKMLIEKYGKSITTCDVLSYAMCMSSRPARPCLRI
jgi:hypothetical protein